MKDLLNSQRVGIVALRKEAYRIAGELDAAYEDGRDAERRELVRLGLPEFGEPREEDLDLVAAAGDRWHGMTGQADAFALASDARALRRWIRETCAA